MIEHFPTLPNSPQYSPAGNIGEYYFNTSHAPLYLYRAREWEVLETPKADHV